MIYLGRYPRKPTTYLDMQHLFIIFGWGVFSVPIEVITVGY